MKCLLILALAAAAHAQSFFPRDTPEVEAAKAAHFAEYARIAARVAAAPADVFSSAPQFSSPVDTPEVAAAKAAHFVDFAKAAIASSPVFRSADPYAEYYRAYYNYYYPSLVRAINSARQAVPEVLPSGYLSDTPEVAHAKATHLYKLYEESARI